MSVKNYKPLPLDIASISEPIDRSPLTPTHYYQTCIKCKSKLKRRKDRLEANPICKPCKLTKHGLTTRKGKTVEYRRWEHMNNRCYNDKDIQYLKYGARGIIVCSEWKDPKVFSDWCMENIPSNLIDSSGLDIHRINNDGNYEPSNCILITRSEHSTIHNQQRRKVNETL